MLLALVICTVVAVLLTAFFLFVRVYNAPIYGLLTKTLASMSFVAMAAIGMYYNYGSLPAGAGLIVAGLAFGMVGDILLDLKRAHSEFEDLYLTSGMTAFTCDHSFVLAAALMIATPLIRNLWFPAVISAVIGIGAAPLVMYVSVKFMKAHFGKHFFFSAFYASYLIFFTALSVWLAILNPVFIMLAVAMVLFLLSDLVLSTMYFVAGKKEDALLVVINHALYYGAQIVIAAWIFII
jgi:hypothetical protein